jgi:two-component system, sensor histidine kinase PdtaS
MEASYSPAAEKDRSSRHLWLVASLIALLLVLILSMLALLIYNEGREATRRAEDRAQAASQVVATNARWITELAKLALGRMDTALGNDLNFPLPAAQATIREAVASLPGEPMAYVVMADGRTLFTTDPNIKAIDIRDREYFSELARGTDFYTSALLTSRLDGSQIFVFSKRLVRDGRFAGAAVISFQASLLREIWQSLRLDPLSTVSFIREDGQLIARYPFAEGPLDLSNYVLFTSYLKAADAGIYHAVSPLDGISRIVGFRRTEGTDIIAISSISTNAAYAAFRRNVTSTLAIAVPALLGLAAAIFWIWRLLQNDQQQRRDLINALEHNRMLVKDTHHRVKNNLQSIMSMVRMHNIPERVKNDLQGRISAMASAHQHLYRVDQVSEIKADALIRGIVSALLKSSETHVRTQYDIEPLIIDRDHATPLALLVNEVVTNAVKHSAGKTGTIKISFKSAPSGQLVLSIADDGPGFDPSRPSEGLGRRLIAAMLTQLNGSASYHFNGGTEFKASLGFSPAATGVAEASAASLRQPVGAPD